MEMMSERYRREHDTEKFARRVCARNVLRYLDGQNLVDKAAKGRRGFESRRGYGERVRVSRGCDLVVTGG